MKLLKDDLIRILRKIFAKQHPLLPEIMIHWSKIVGPKFSTNTNPLRITANIEKRQRIHILHVQAENQPIGVELSFQKEIIIERIAVYLGFRAIQDIRVTVHKSVER